MAGQQIDREINEEPMCVCPFCENVVEMPAPWCSACGAQISYCIECKAPLQQEATVCANCGAECGE